MEVHVKNVKEDAGKRDMEDVAAVAAQDDSQIIILNKIII
jgi:hypothetical protein